MSYCPACGNPVSDTTARFCMKCGRELPAAAAPSPPAAPPTPTQVSPAPVAPPPPVHAAPTATYPGAGPAGYPVPPGAPAAPSPGALFVRRVFSGSWAPALTAALIPAVTLLVAAGALGAWLKNLSDGSVGWWTYTRGGLAIIMMGLGGHLSGKGPDDDCSGINYDYDDYDSGFGSGSSGCHDVGASLSSLLLVVTLLYVLALVLSLRAMRRRQAGAEAAVRVALLSAVAAIVLAFIGEVEVDGGQIHDTPFLVLLWSFLISLVTALVVLNGPALGAKLGAAYRVLGTALRGLLIAVLFAGVVVFLIAVGYEEELGLNGDGVLALALGVPNSGVHGLALAFGAPFQVRLNGEGAGHASFGLGQLDDYWDGAALPLALVAAAICALIVGFLAVRRTRGGAEPYMVAAAFSAMFTLLVVAAGVTMRDLGAVGVGDFGGGGAEMHYGAEAGKALLFSLLWSMGGVIAASFLTRVFSGPPPVGGQGVSYAPYGAAPYGRPPQGAAAPYAAPPAGPYAAGPSAQTPPPAAPYIPQQAAPPQAQPPAQPQPPAQAQPQPQPGPQAPAPAAEVHDLGVVQPDRLAKRDEPRDEPRDGDGGGSAGGGRHQ